MRALLTDLNGKRPQSNSVKAVRVDPDFALAHYRLSLAAGFLGRDPESTDAAERALALPQKLPPSFTDFLKGNVLYRKGAYHIKRLMFSSTH